MRAPHGDQSCPLEGYSGFDDSRACEVCTCGDVVDGGCTTSLEFFTSDDCSGAVNETLSGGGFQCAQAGGSNSVELVAEVTGSSSPGPAAPVGAAVPNGLETVCCMP